ncbi:MAG: c-type cytochrome [Deltaproteobacteria bacterium]|nr:c-type cytochrome [Deltaproteobacteria bacterium]
MSDEHNDYDGISYRAETKSPAVFRALLCILVAWGVCFIGYYLFSGWSSEAEFAQKRQAKQQQQSLQPAMGGTPSAVPLKEGKRDEYIAMGKKEFGERCAACHGADGKGAIGTDLTRPDYKYGRSEQAIAQSITEGRPGGMPSFKNDLSHEKIEGLVAFILSLK